jgi:hypothetical protein
MFRAEFSEFGLSVPVVFGGEPDNGVTTTRFLMDLMSFRKRPDARNPRRWVTGAAAAGAVALAARRAKSAGTEVPPTRVL